MALSFNLHKSKNKADWQYVKPNDRNMSQKIAAKTSGMVTPANIISLVGAILVIIGALLIARENILLGISLIIVGRLADIADGYVADKTGTKSPLGEAFDAAIDKLIGLIVVIILFINHSIPLLVLLILFIQGTANVLLGIAAKYKRVPLHPSFEGKISVALCWSVIAGYLLANYLRVHAHGLSSAITVVCTMLLIGFMYYGFYSTVMYYRQLRSQRLGDI